MSFNMQHAAEFRFLFKVQNSRSKRTTQRTLIDEEYGEFVEAERFIYDEKFRANDAEALKELADLVYVCYQYAENMEWDLDQALMRVHKSNLSKLDEHAQPIYREDGKVLKSEFYEPPTLTDLV
jgi:predicted HAD superfamily Cof-like phosphohydrolase